MARTTRNWNGGILELLHFTPVAMLALPAVILGWLGPHVASMLSGAQHEAPRINTVAGKVIQEGKYRSNVRLEFPSSIRISQTINVRAWLQPETARAGAPFSGKLESGDFKITPTNASDSASTEYKYQWDWLISPDKPGDRALYFWVDPSTELVVNGNTADVRLGPAKNKVLLPISVLTELGLTTAQDAWAKAIGAFLGVIGTVAAYTFWKWNRKEKENGSGNESAALNNLDGRDNLKREHKPKPPKRKNR